MHGRRGRDTPEFHVARLGEAFQNAIRVFRLVWETNPKLTLLMSALTGASALVPAATAWVSKLVFDEVGVAVTSGIDTVDIRRIVILMLAFLGITAGGFLLRNAQAATRSILGDLFTNRTNLMILDKSESLDISYFENAAFYDRLENAQREARDGPMQIVSESFGIIQNSITLISMIGLLLRFEWWVFIVVLITTMPALVVEIRYSRERFRLQTWRSPTVRRLGYFRWLITNDDYIKELRIFDLGRYLINLYRRTFDRFFRENTSLTLRSNTAGFALQALGAAGSAAILGFIVFQTMLRRVTLGDLMLYFQAYQQTVNSTTQLLQGITSIYERGLFVNNFFEFLEFEPLIPAETEGIKVPDPIRQGIEFEDVHFTYPGTDNPVLRGVTFRISPGESAAFVGSNGAGKTTIIKLMCRFYEPDAGTIRIDGIDIREFDTASLRRQIGVIFQDYGRYQETAYTNVGYGSIENIGDKERVLEASSKSGAHRVIEGLPDGYQTQLGRWFRDGVNISIGEWQKIALARGFMREAQLLILDEPTSSLDVQSEHEVFERFRDLTADKMAILISHRFTTVRMADNIIVIDDGKIIEQGTHEELMELAGRYSVLFDMQAEAYR
ncbi:MAG: ABC transporter ATP-binding protein [Chloroflexi bacterium]|nr:ABC transporter ATP-binding protein [Chloroflexota bacterium]MCY3938940.1 ABC transporter ATP-binding protein [Chloroflexota bacterium]